MWWDTLFEYEPSDDPLHKEQWRFWLNVESHKCLAITLDKHAKLSRATKRHKFKIDSYWSRLDHRDCTMPREEPPDWVKKEIKQLFIDSILFK